MATMHQRTLTRTQQQQQGDALTSAQLSAYRQTGTPMSDTEATAYLLSQLSTQQLRDLHSKHVAARGPAPKPQQRQAAQASAFMAPCGGYADTGSDMLDSNFANLRDLPEPLRATSALQADAIARTDGELTEFVGAVLRSRWTKAAAAMLAISVALLLTACGGGDDHDDHFEPALTMPQGVVMVGDPVPGATVTPTATASTGRIALVHHIGPAGTGPAAADKTRADCEAARAKSVTCVVVRAVDDGMGAEIGKWLLADEMGLVLCDLTASTDMDANLIRCATAAAGLRTIL